MDSLGSQHQHPAPAESVLSRNFQNSQAQTLGMVYGADSKRKFSTAEETAYPMLLAYTIAFFITQELISMGWQPPALEFPTPETMTY